MNQDLDAPEMRGAGARPATAKPCPQQREPTRPGLTRLAQGLRATGTRSLVQLHHGGVRADPGLAGRIIAPFDDSETGTVAMDGGDVRQMIQDYVAAAVRAEQAGFDGVEVRGAHGFLIAHFLDRSNQRSDGYGGSLEHRMRALLEVLAGIRSATGDGFQVGMRLRQEASGSPLDEGREVALQVLNGGVVDFVDKSMRDVYATPHYEGDNDSLLIDAFTSLPRGDTVLSGTGCVLSADDAAWCLSKGRRRRRNRHRRDPAPRLRPPCPRRSRLQSTTSASVPRRAAF